MQFNRRLKMLRQDRGLTVEEMAEKIGVEPRVMNSFEVDEFDPSYEVLCRMADVLNVSVDHLLGRRSPKTVDVTGLNTRQVVLINELIAEMRNKN